MAASEPDYQTLIAQIDEANRERDEAKREREDIERGRDEAERKLQNTTLPEYLDACHRYLHIGLAVQTDAPKLVGPKQLSTNPPSQCYRHNMAASSPDYETLLAQFHEERRKREEAERKREEAERKREEAERKLQDTTLPEYLDACHHHLHSNLTVQTITTLATQGDPANANKKLRPKRLQEWDQFPEQQAGIWEDLMDSDLVSERHFHSLAVLEGMGKTIAGRSIGSELDLHFFQRGAVDDHVTSIIQCLYKDPTVRQKFGLQGSIAFENHANTLSPEAQLQEGIEQMTVSGKAQRRSPRLTKDEEVQSANSMESTEPDAAGRANPTRSSRPAADQFCVYNTSVQGVENRVAAFVVEYKAPHKLPLGYIYSGLEDMVLEDVIRRKKSDDPRDRFRRLIAAVITQVFSYMVKIGSEYGCVGTGEATIFLKIPEDPTTVYYFLSVPKGDVGESTEWTTDSGGTGRLHLTAVGQMLAFTLGALQKPPRSQQWRVAAASKLPSWEVLDEDLVMTISREDAPSSDYKPPPNLEALRLSPIKLRPRRPPITSQSCAGPQDQHAARDDEHDEHDPDTPSRPPPSSQHMARTHPTASSSSPSQKTGKGQSGQYCTQKCLLGLVHGGPLDASCPNVRDHGKGHHQIDAPTFLARIRQQLSRDLDTDCEPVRRGACGVFFRIRLKSHGYAVAAKCFPIESVRRFRHEATVYGRLRSIQGIHVPVHLGNIDLKTPYYYEGICELVHVMFLSFGGTPISKHLTPENRAVVTSLAHCSAQAIHNLGVLHQDLEARNMLWNRETGGVMVIDFDIAEFVRDAGKAKPRGGGRSSFLQERGALDYELSTAVGGRRVREV
ncbi:hypothetical protein BDV96DRAFT_592779 [Lophiotrema nucula]|uniref:Protein kinase domain-containing protein n=1 Tax=Lophiotrema nucula TaxID=690887 RepID=A0A6A5YGJ5_9PLEO|nr:hypothetical protein BDV96DRAFT_592779 [Lophiotrema nucula]